MIRISGVLILFLSVLMQIQAKIYLSTGVRNTATIINLTLLQQHLEIHLPASSNKIVNDTSEALSSLHTFTGCD